MSPGPDQVAALQVDFGDGDQQPLPVTKLRDGGTATVVHAYEPTLAPRTRTVRATATDGTGQVRQASRQFETRAAYRVSYSPLAVTALDKCDTFGTGDFALTWQLDPRPARSSEFKLGKGQTYLEEGFRVGYGPVHYDQEGAVPW